MGEGDWVRSCAGASVRQSSLALGAGLRLALRCLPAESVLMAGSEPRPLLRACEDLRSRLRLRPRRGDAAGAASVLTGVLMRPEATGSRPEGSLPVGQNRGQGLRCSGLTPKDTGKQATQFKSTLKAIHEITLLTMPPGGVLRLRRSW